MPLSEVAPMPAKAPCASGVIPASEPPTRHASRTPWRTSRKPLPSACAPAAQAETVPYVSPLIVCRIAIVPLAALAIISGTASGESAPGPRSRRMSCWASIVPMPPIPVPITQPTRSGS